MPIEQSLGHDSAAAPATPVPPSSLLAPCSPLRRPAPLLCFEPCSVGLFQPAGLFDLPEGVLDAIFGCLGLGDLATACCASLSFHAHCQACGVGRGVLLLLLLLPHGWPQDCWARGPTHHCCMGMLQCTHLRGRTASCPPTDGGRSFKILHPSHTTAVRPCELPTSVPSSPVCTAYPSAARTSSHHPLQRALGLKLELCAADDLRLLPRQHNALLLGAGAICSPGGYGSACSTGPTSSSGGISKGDPGSSSSAGSGAYDRQRQRVLGYVPAALHYARWGSPAALPPSPEFGAPQRRACLRFMYSFTQKRRCHGKGLVAGAPLATGSFPRC